MLCSIPAGHVVYAFLNCWPNPRKPVICSLDFASVRMKRVVVPRRWTPMVKGSSSSLDTKRSNLLRLLRSLTRSMVLTSNVGLMASRARKSGSSGCSGQR